MATEDEANPLGPAWVGWETYRRFAESVKTSLRYVRHKAANDLLADVLATCGERKVTIPKGKMYWRARLGCEYELVTSETVDMDVSWDRERPYSHQGMKPVSNWHSEGRANPRGIPYLYLATTRDTALAEVRPWIGSVISIARFEIQRDLTVIDCSKHHSMKTAVGVMFDKTRSREDGIWMAIDLAFAEPVTREDSGGEYIPTQIVAELFKNEGFDGILYKSLLSDDGLNIALFNLDDARIVRCALSKLASIRFDFQPDEAEYFVHDVHDSGV